MPFCSNCGRQLEENEVCNCRNQQNTAQNQTPPPPTNANVQPGFQQYDQYGRPLFTPQGQPIYYDAQGNAIVGGQKKKNKSGCIIALCVALFVFLVIGAVLAAILVPAMLGYVRKSKVHSANINAKTIAVQFDSALTDIEGQGTPIDGKYIICSDRSDNVILDISEGFSVDTLYSKAKLYGSISDYDWFVVIENGKVAYAAAESSGDEDDYVGTYPTSSDTKRGSPTYGGSYINNIDVDLDDLYDKALEAFYY